MLLKRTMYFFHDKLVNHALQMFKATEFETAREGDAFFGIFAPGNTIHFADRPFERFNDYEELLLRLMQADPVKYQRMHKGTAFGFMAWLAFDLRSYEKGLFYLDAGISEDIRKADPPETWIDNPGPRVLILDVDPANNWFSRTVHNVKGFLERELTRFNRISNRPPLSIHSWQGFVRNLIADPTTRTIISAIYVFLLKFEDRRQELLLREGSAGGSNQPFTVHLSTGGLIFESLLKHCYPTNNDGNKNRKLEGVWKYTALFLRDFSLCDPPPASAESLREIHEAIEGSTSMETAFSTAAKLRNTTGHNLVWDDIFSTPAKYVDLFQQVMNAILYLIARKLV
jgi:hypothetical protein